MRVFKTVCALWSEAFQELAQVLGRSLTLRNGMYYYSLQFLLRVVIFVMIACMYISMTVLGLLSEGQSMAHQTSHFDCAPGILRDPADSVGHITALGYMEVCVTKLTSSL